MKTMVVGVDASERGAIVFRKAMQLAIAQGARLVVLRAVGIPVEMPNELMSVKPNDLPAMLVRLAEASLKKFVAEHTHDTVVPLSTVEARIGTPWQVLCDAATEFQADLLVVGSHGYNALDRLIGTNAARVVNHAPCSVLVVRDA